MSLDPISLCAVGMILLLAGGGLFVRSLLSRKKESGWPPVVAGALLTGLGVGLAVWRFELWIVVSSLTLGAAGLVMGLLRSGAVAWAATLLGRPLVQSALVVVGGVALILLGVARIDGDVAREIDDAEQLMALSAGTAAPDMTISFPCRTDQGRLIPLHPPRTLYDQNIQDRDAEFIRRQKLEARLIQTAPAHNDYNCHGWVFADGRYWLLGRWVETVLMDNGYREVQRPQPGDVAVFRDGNGEVSHSALVRGRGSDGVVLMESKWGQLGRFVHTAEQHAYKGHTIRYYRTKRSSHMLAGLDTSKPADPIVAAAEEE